MKRRRPAGTFAGGRYSPPVLLLGKYRVYFPFADGLFGYNCPRCGFQCCKGAGFAATPGELVTLRRLYPTLAYFTSVSKKPQPVVDLLNFKPACYFLREDGFCDVHVSHGRPNKPYVCKTFPVNALRLHGDVLVADVNFLCPLDLYAASAQDTAIRHDDLLADLVEHAEVAIAGAKPGVLAIDAARVDEEERLRDATRDLPLMELCATYEAAALGEEPGARRSGLDDFCAAVATFLRAPRAVLGADESVDRRVAALAPRLRLLVPAQYAWLGGEALALVGRVVAVLGLYARLVRSVNRAPVTLATVHGLHAQLGLVVYFLAHIDRVPRIDVLEGDEWSLPMAAGVEAEAQRLLAFIYEDNDAEGCTLGEIFDRIGVEDPMVRVQVLQSFTTEATKAIRFSAR